MLTVSALFTAVASLRYFTNDRGEMIVERGIDKVKAGPRTKVLIRALAAVAAVHLALIVFYNIPNSWIGIHSDEWPADLQKRSYLTNYVCGDGTDRACPGPALPNARFDTNDFDGGSAYVTPGGGVVIPEDTTVPPAVPFDRGKPGD